MSPFHRFREPVAKFVDSRITREVASLSRADDCCDQSGAIERAQSWAVREQTIYQLPLKDGIFDRRLTLGFDEGGLGPGGFVVLGGPTT